VKKLTAGAKAWIRLQMDIAEEICIAQEKTKMRWSTVAKKAGITDARIYDIRCTTFEDMTLLELQKIARALGHRLDLFLCSDDTDEWAVKRAVSKIQRS
jgi:hypothetical protein